MDRTFRHFSEALLDSPPMRNAISRSRSLVASALAACALALALAAIALAAAPLPKPSKAYTTPTGTHKVGLTLVTGSNPKAIEPGAAALGSQYALSGGSIQCPKAKKGPGFHQVPFAIFGFPGAKLKLVHGKYGFAKTIRQRETIPLGSTGVKAFTLKVKIAGTVLSPTKIAGTVTAKGGPCTTKKPLKYTAKLNSKVPVAPASASLASRHAQTGKSLHLKGEVVKAKAGKNGHPGSANSSTVILRSGSETVGKLALKDCNGLAINELTCSGKGTLRGVGAGLEVVIRWPCEIVGESGKFTCASVGSGFMISKGVTRATIRVKTAEANIEKLHRRFPVEVHIGG